MTFRDLEPDDLTELSWSGGPAHLRVLAESWQRSLDGEVAVLVGELRSGALIASGGVRLTAVPGIGELWMLAVHPFWQSLGVGTALIEALEGRAAAAGHRQVQLGVELDNPDAERLYRRLGYRPCGRRPESWPLDDGSTYHTEVRLLRRPLGPVEPGRSEPVG